MTDELVETLAVSGGTEGDSCSLEAIRARGIDELMVSHVAVADEEAETRAAVGDPGERVGTTNSPPVDQPALTSLALPGFH
jgi:hypothetical protein